MLQSLRGRLGVGFGVLLGLLLVIAVAATGGIDRIHAVFTGIASRDIPAVQRAAALVNTLQDLSGRAIQSIRQDQPVDAARALAADSRQAMRQDVERLRAIAQADPDAARREAMLAAVDAAATSLDRFHQDAAALFDTRATQLQAMRRAREANAAFEENANNAVSLLQNLVRLQERAMQTSESEQGNAILAMAMKLESQVNKALLLANKYLMDKDGESRKRLASQFGMVMGAAEGLALRLKNTAPDAKQVEQAQSLMDRMAALRRVVEGEAGIFAASAADLEADAALAGIVRSLETQTDATANALRQVAQLAEQGLQQSRLETDDLMERVLLVIGVVTAVALAGGVVLALLIARSVLGPVGDCLQFARGVAAGDFSSALRRRHGGELGQLAQAMQTMVAELKTRLGFTRGVMDSVSVPYAVVNVAGAVTETNAPMLTLLGLPGQPGDYLGRELAAFFPPGELKPGLHQDVLGEGRTIANLVARFQNFQGQTRHGIVDIAPLKDLDGALLGSFWCIQDVTDLAQRQETIDAWRQVTEQAVNEAGAVAEQLASASEELAAQVAQAAEGAQRQRRQAEEAEAVIETMRHGLDQGAHTAQQASQRAADARAQATQGADVVRAMVERITTLQAKAETLSNHMTSLGDRAQAIGAVLTTITDIADQTNLLALNAAIEAARAGDAGRGFAVVADEVRKLAEKTMQATREVGEAVAAIQTSAAQSRDTATDALADIQSSASLAADSGRSLETIVRLAEDTASRMIELAQASQGQRQDSQAVGEAAAGMRDIAATTAQIMDQSREAVDDLARSASRLQQAMASLRQNQA